ncbi:MAG: ABC transporter ATP-binding protein [bacterium]|nr:ABC transporter ATP-binding protein [bacterium]
MLEVSDFVVHYGEIHALKGISLYVEEGNLITLIGANGAGKTTLLNALTGVIKPSSGTVTFKGQSIAGLRSDEIVRLGISHVPEGRKIFAELTTEENLVTGAYILKSRTKVKENLDLVYDLFPRLAERRKQEGGTLSGGEQQMLAIARGIMSDPEILFLDEPSLGLAPLIAERIFDFIVKINNSGKTILLVEQNANVALQIASYGYVLETGTITIEDSTKHLRDNENVKKAYMGIA